LLLLRVETQQEIAELVRRLVLASVDICQDSTYHRSTQVVAFFAKRFDVVERFPFRQLFRINFFQQSPDRLS